MQPPSHLSPGAQAYLRDPDQLVYPDDWADPWSVQEFRDVAHPLWCGLNDLIDFDYSVTESALSGVAVERVAVGESRAGVALLHLHGGMYCSGTPAIDRVMNAQVARATGVEVISPDYRLAPEHPFPAALDDAVAVYRALVGTGARVAVFGESAGGGLAAACALAVADAGLPTPAGLALLSPMLDLTGSSDTYRTLSAADPDYSDTENLLRPGRAYAGNTALDHRLISPVYADLNALPDTLVQVGGREVLLGDSSRFVRAARSAGVTVDLHVLDGGWHNFLLWRGVPEADSAIDELTNFLERVLK